MEAKKVSFQQRNLRMGLDPPRRGPRPLSVPRCWKKALVHYRSHAIPAEHQAQFLQEEAGADSGQ
ncbi:unnamed protein product, partial [Pylaiella littoralis]